MSKPKYSTVIKERRLKKCLSQPDLLNLMGEGEERAMMNRSRVSKWESGVHLPSLSAARKLAEVLGGEPSDYRDQSED